MEKECDRRSPCPIACVLDLVGDRWTLLVVRDLVLGKRYFDEFARSPEGIATNILAARLKQLTEAGFVEKRPDEADRRRTTYVLSEKGRSLRGLVKLIAAWGLRNIPGTAVPPGVRLGPGSAGGVGDFVGDPGGATPAVDQDADADQGDEGQAAGLGDR